jgi:WhiB family transcriptional regulator, redox-sensing transcriptional regulator
MGMAAASGVSWGCAREELLWQTSADCRAHKPTCGSDSDLFFHPENERGQAREQRESAAKAVCGRCPVLERCRQHALSVGETYGVWGGMSEAERVRTLETTR